MTAIRPQPGIMDIALYQGGASTIAGKSHVLKLSSNENPAGFSDAAKEAFLRAAHDLHRYPGTDHARLRAAIGEVQGLDPDNIICGVGSDEVLQFVTQSYCGVGDEVIYTEHGFSLYPLLAMAAGATPVKVAERERKVDVDAILSACTKKTRIVFLTNPGNPTGTMIEPEEIAWLADKLPPQVLLVLDSAYAEFADGYDGGAALVSERQNMIMTRTFSKIHGLGGLRIGWGYAPRAIIDVLNRVRQPFNLSEVQLSVAEAAMRDTAWVEKCRNDNAKWRAWLRNALIDLGVEVDQSFANFILARFVDGNEAAGCDAHLRDNGIIVRRVTGYGFPEALRITVGDEAACRQVVHAVAQFKGLR
ncbi:histidinol-phosphate aminotransferase [Ketogulonicigenium robustum]|uniref:Histidinol-phosphate aminotransferase n=1 Tax=Ketogulonicigenium robustum TaxID=92947 RepID=A0A1W6NXV2_9RHOB|nr:histidinol-phosphate transaminase [Ketogulonicigenium robustum]ARO14054.1 histidinol-phosphate aminotransferase [Ketogulonicigenium robustum]